MGTPAVQLSTDPPSRSAPTRLAGAFYFFYYAAMAALFPFLPLHYEQLGLSGSQIGLLVGIPPVLTLLGASLWGGVADATQRHRLVLGLAIVGTMAFALLLSSVALFLWLIPVVVAFALFTAPIVPLADNTVLEILADRRDRYGRIRLWGAIGWGAAAPPIGWLVEQFGLGWSFHGYLALMLICLLIALCLPVARVHLSSPFQQGLRTLLADPQWRLFLFVAFIGGAGLGFVHHFLFLYMGDIGASQSTMGWALTTATLSELIFFFYTDRWLRRWGVRPLLIVAMLATAFRLLAYSATDAPYLVLVIQFLHGPSFAMMWTAGVSYAGRLAPPGLGATAQGLFTGVNFGLAGGTGALVGGYLYEHWGSAAMYRWAGIAVLAGLLLFIVASRGESADSPNSP